MNDHEPIRKWYRRTTRAALIALCWTAVISIVFSVVAFLFIPQDVTAKLQVFNGAFTIPVFGGLWIASFIFLWLNPSREVMFRSQESMERMGSDIESRLARVDRVIAYLEESVDKDVLGKVEGHMAAIREAIEERTRPLPTPSRRRPIDGDGFMPVDLAGGDGNGNGD